MNSVLSSILLVSILLTTSFFVQVSSKSCNHYSDCASREICDSGNCRNLKILKLYECVDIYNYIDDERCIFGECRTPTLGGLCISIVQLLALAKVVYAIRLYPGGFIWSLPYQ